MKERAFRVFAGLLVLLGSAYVQAQRAEAAFLSARMLAVARRVAQKAT